MENKPKLGFNNLYDKLIEKGVTFPNHTKEEVIEYLRSISYYYKISSYRKNFKKNSEGYYENLTFDALLITASIDVYTRELLLDMCLDIEHSVKTSLMTSITENESENGYNLINVFKKEYPDKYNDIVTRFRKSSYKRDMFEKRTNISIWVFLEIIDFGTLNLICQLYFELYPDVNDSVYSKQLMFIKNIRNTCAHNNVFLINLFDKRDHIPRPETKTKSYASNMKINLGLVHYPKINDIINLFYVHKQLCSKKLNERRYRESILILDKYSSNVQLFSSSTHLQKFFNSIFNKSVDFLIS
ncbi:Abi family protein [Lactococcus lactis]|uniref:Abi family protein n=1 Tax=Lactococcus lactis TaxID=1358 RepID=UPI00207CFCFD|nr:Abi family protein [Lactococcus lactis]MCO0817419.1 Abi family protein [Lactococcus lactis]